LGSGTVLQRNLRRAGVSPKLRGFLPPGLRARLILGAQRIILTRCFGALGGGPHPGGPNPRRDCFVHRVLEEDGCSFGGGAPFLYGPIERSGGFCMITPAPGFSRAGRSTRGFKTIADIQRIFFFKKNTPTRFFNFSQGSLHISERGVFFGGVVQRGGGWGGPEGANLMAAALRQAQRERGTWVLFLWRRVFLRWVGPMF